MLSSFKFSFRYIRKEIMRSYSQDREARMLDKLLKRGMRKKTKSNKLSAEFFRPEEMQLSRKAIALNKVYMEHVSEALAVGKSYEVLDKLGIEITKVQVHRGTSSLKAYWVCKNPEVTEEEILSALQIAAVDVKNQINSLRYIGKIPELKFVKDKETTNTLVIERLLSLADFGRDFQPTYPSPSFKSGPDTHYEEPLPEMRQDVLGLDHDNMTRLLQARVDKGNVKLNLPKGEINSDEGACGLMKTIPFDKEIYHIFFKKKRNQEMKLKKEMRAKALEEELGEKLNAVEEQYEDEEYEYEDEEEEQVEEEFTDDFEENLRSKDWKPPFVK